MSPIDDLKVSLQHVADLPEISISASDNPAFGEYTSTVAMAISAKSHANPREVAQGIVDKILKNKPACVEKIVVAGPGFINFTLTNEVLVENLREILEKKEFVKSSSPKIAVVEFSSPNIAKPFTVGHLRSTIIGDAIANLLASQGFSVHKDNHVGDWGTQFGKLIVAIKKWGNESEIAKADRPVKELVNLYVKFHSEAETNPQLEEEARAWFTKLESRDPEARRLWERCIEWSWVEFDKIYQELGISFTENAGRGYGESYFEDKMEPVVDELRASGYLKTGDEGAQLFFFPEESLPALMILKKDGSTLYATRDLATDKFRLEKYGKDVVIINEVGAEQELYFRQLYQIESLLGWYRSDQRVHVKHGHFRFTNGKMSTRKGNVVWLEDVIAEAKTRASKLASDKPATITNTIAIGALKWNDLKRAASLDVTFDWDEILTMNGNSGPYVQYAVVRAKSVLAKAGSNFSRLLRDPALAGQFDESERAVARELLYFEEILRRAAQEYAPHLLCTYLYGLAGTFNSFYNSTRILGETERESARLALCSGVAEVLTRGLGILGIKVPEEM